MDTVVLEQEQTFLSAITDDEKLSLMDEIICGKKIKFQYVNGDKLLELLKMKGYEHELEFENDNSINLFHMNVLKYNFNKIITQMAEYFPDVKINKFENSSCITECKIKQEKFAYKYDLYMIISKNDKVYEYAYDFFSNALSINENKYSHSKTLLDDYQYFISDDICSNNDIERYLNENIFKLLTAICALKNDEYQLAEIMFVKSNIGDKTQKQILKQLGYFLRVIQWKKSNEFNIRDFFDECMFTDKQTEETITFKKFTKTLNLICDKNDVKFDVENKVGKVGKDGKDGKVGKDGKDGNFEIFEEIIFNIGEYFESSIISQYKLVYKKAMKILMDSLTVILELVKEINNKKTFTPDYINDLIEFHLNEYKDQTIIEKLYFNKINEKKILFENLFNEINAYCDNNKHNEDKLDKIKIDYDLLYDDILNF